MSLSVRGELSSRQATLHYGLARRTQAGSDYSSQPAGESVQKAAYRDEMK